jgi:hypothetical protein
LGLIAPASWTEAGGNATARINNGSLELEQSEAVILEISTFLEKLRVARGLPKKSSFDEKLFQPVSRTAKAKPGLSKSVTLNYSRPTSFPKIVRRLAQEAGVSILIDWQAIGQLGWTPDTEVTLLVTNKPLSESLTTLLTPMELAYRIVDESIFQITTPAELAARNELEFYRVESLLEGAKNGEGLLKRIQDAVPPEWFAGPDSSGVLRLDPSSRCLLVQLPQSKQQMLEKLLDEWKATGR